MQVPLAPTFIRGAIEADVWIGAVVWAWGRIDPDGSFFWFLGLWRWA